MKIWARSVAAPRDYILSFESFDVLEAFRAALQEVGGDEAKWRDFQELRAEGDPDMVRAGVPVREVGMGDVRALAEELAKTPIGQRGLTVAQVTEAVEAENAAAQTAAEEELKRRRLSQDPDVVGEGSFSERDVRALRWFAMTLLRLGLGRPVVETLLEAGLTEGISPTEMSEALLGVLQGV